MTAYVENFADALPSKERMAEVRKQLEDAGVEYVLSSWIDHVWQPKTKPVPISDFEPLCHGQGPAIRRSFDLLRARTIGPADSPTRCTVPDLDAV